MTNRAAHRRPRWTAVLAALGLGATALVVVAVPAAAAPASAGATSRVAQADPNPDDRTDDDDPSLKSQYDEVIGQEAELLQRLSDARSASEQAKTALADLEAKVVAKQGELADAQTALTGAEDEVVRQETATERAERRVAAAKERLRAQAVASYVQGGAEGESWSRCCGRATASRPAKRSRSDTLCWAAPTSWCATWPMLAPPSARPRRHRRRPVRPRPSNVT